MRITIIGGGIGGLTAALALHDAGHEVRVYEAAARIEALGVGINLLPHCVRVLDGLGLLAALRDVAIETSSLSYWNKSGSLIWREPRGVAAGYAWPQLSIHRGELQMILLEAARARLGADAIVTGHAFVDLAQDAQCVRCTLEERASGRRVDNAAADLVIGADGIHSTVRRKYYPDEGPAKFSGRMLWRAVSDTPPFLDGRSMIMAGHQDQKFVCYPVSRWHAERGRSLTNWIAELATPGATPPRSDWNRRVDRDVFRAPFADWRFDWLDVPAIIDAAPAIYEFPMVDRDPLPRWSFERVTLLGDAAHPMYPIGSNGASQAILDADALTAALAAERDPVRALECYDAERRPATARIVELNRKNGPEQVMQLAEERAPRGFTDIEQVIPRAELEAIAARYKQVAGFAVDKLQRADQ
jgi:5-methylphenazine-1-carboxylate 1-monooxygenase